MVVGGRSTTYMNQYSSSSFTTDLLDPRKPCLDNLMFPFKTVGSVGAFVGGITAFFPVAIIESY